MQFRFNHIGITVSDLDKSVEFYRTLFGLPPGLYVDILTEDASADGQGRVQRVAFVPIGETGLIELHEFTPTREALGGGLENTGYAYLSFDVDDLEAEYDRLVKLGVDIMASLREIYVEAPDGSETPRWQKVCDVRDPDGKRVELVENDTRLQTPAINHAARQGLARPDHPYVVRV
ncbi:VOC family protein [Rhodococcus koreensis]|uniref:VOC family protein n=1 Tax=Rhodococcus koreensis TaxID=99653 RepID=UPI00366AB3D2